MTWGPCLTTQDPKQAKMPVQTEALQEKMCAMRRWDEGLSLTQHHHLPQRPLCCSARPLCSLIGLGQGTGVFDRCCIPLKELLPGLHSSIGGLRLVHLVLRRC